MTDGQSVLKDLNCSWDNSDQGSDFSAQPVVAPLSLLPLPGSANLPIGVFFLP